MVSEQWVFQAIAAGKTYDSLPTRIKNTLSFTEWKNKCAQNPLRTALSSSVAKQSEALLHTTRIRMGR